jgi:hypothetical protein
MTVENLSVEHSSQAVSIPPNQSTAALRRFQLNGQLKDVWNGDFCIYN